MRIILTCFYVFFVFFTVSFAQNTQPVKIALSPVNAACGERVCMEVRVQDFTNILSFQYSMNWDENVLGQASIQAFGIPDLNESNFNANSPGILRVGWDDTNTVGITLPDDHLLYQICFDVLSEVSTTADVQFAGNPVPIEIFNADLVQISSEFENSFISIICENEVDTTDNGNNASPLAFSLNTINANCGEQICLEVSVEGFTNIASFQYSLNWDDAILGGASFQQFGIADLNASNFNLFSPSVARVSWDDTNLQGITLPDGHVLYQVCFSIPQDANGSGEVQFSGDPLSVEVVDVQGNEVTPALHNGLINITCDTGPVDSIGNDSADSLVFSLNSTTVNCGEQTCLDLRVSDFMNIASFQYSLNWDANVLGSVQVQQFGIADLSAANFNTSVPGMLRVGWDDTNLQGVTLPDNQLLFQVCFDAIGDVTASSTVQFSNNPIPIEVTDAQGNITTPDFQHGSVSVNCEVEPPVDNGDAVRFALSSSTTNCGEQTCLQVSVRNFQDILSFQYSIIWDASVLGTASVQQFGLPDLDNANFNARNAGVLRVGWDDTFITGVTLPDDHILFEICFNAIGDNDGQTLVQFAGSPTSIEVVNRESVELTPEFQNGQVNVTCSDGNTGNAGTDLMFLLSETTANCDQQACLDVSVQNFQDILSFQYSIRWDPTVLGTASVQQFGLPDLNNSNFNLTSPGVLRIGWDDTFITGATLPDNQVIFQICFDATNEAVNAMAFQFSGNPTSIEVYNADSEELNPAFRNGSLSITCDNTGGIVDNDNDGFANDVDCDDNNAAINPNATEIANNGIDEDCNGADLIITDLVDNDNDGYTNDVDCDDNNASIHPGATEFPNNNVDEDCDGIAQYFDNDNDGWNSSIDCDDNNPNINGNATEIPNNGIDEDCDGADLIITDLVDNDNDGYTNDVDCDDNNASIHPGATEFPNNNVDEDCDGIAQYFDNDNDGWNSSIDCDDNNPNINGNATEIPNNGIDEDCDGADLITTDLVDNDNDGYTNDVDCDDNNAAINPGASEIVNNNVDEDCDGIAQIIDNDNDGFNSDADCDDNNAAINPGATEIANNGIDEDCNGEDLIVNVTVDNDNDGYTNDVDCDDNNAAINPGASEIVNNNVDENCDGIAQIIDNDNDGFNSDVDCDDNNAAINPGATEIPDNGIDEDCNGTDLISNTESAISLIVADGVANCGEQVCLNVSTKNFVDILSFQFSLRWDPEIFSNATVQEFNLEGLTSASFSTPENGLLRASWLDLNVAGMTLTDDHILFQVCFDVTANSTTTAAIRFSDDPVPIEIVDSESNIVNSNLEDGSVSIVCNSFGTQSPMVATPVIWTSVANQSELQGSPSESKIENVQLFPNPVKSELHIQLEKPLIKNGLIRFYNIWGQLVQTSHIAAGANSYVLNIDILKAGAYLIEIQEGQAFFRGRIMKHE